jgi:microcystin-dependent protein
MAYEVPFTDSTNKGTITVDDNALNTETSVTLIGRNLQDYGQSLNKNFLQLLENYADVNPPVNPVEGQLWYDTSDGAEQLKIYDGTNWVAAGGLKKGVSEPSVTNSVIGDLWVDTTNSQLKLYTGSGWILVGPNYSDGDPVGAIPTVITDITNAQRNVIKNYAKDVSGNSVVVSIISDVEFKPKSVEPGFPTIYKGITMRNFGNVSESIIKGTSSRSQSILKSGEAIDGSRLPVLNVENTFSQKIIINNDNGIEVGSPTKARFIAQGTGVIVQSNQPGGNVDLQVNNSGVLTTAIRVKSDTFVGIGANNLNPTAELDVSGDVVVSNSVSIEGGNISSGPTSGDLTVTGGVGIGGRLYVGETFTVNQSTGDITAADILPDTANIRVLGNSGLPYKSIHVNTVTTSSILPPSSGNLSITGNLFGNASTASKLSSPTIIQMSGDVSSSGFSFDGQAGGLTKTFITTIDPAFISSKDNIVTELGRVISTDEILIYRPTADDVTVDPTGGTGLYKATKEEFVDSLPTIPVGTVQMYAGTTVPDGWFICDGEPKLIADYGKLRTALGYDSADPTTWYFGDPSDRGYNPNLYFSIPDYRGRMPVGLGLPGGANRITDAAVETLGGIGGNDEVTINSNNLPDHTHDLRSDSGDQFYATAVATYSGTGVSSTDGDTVGTGSRLENSGGITSGTANAALNIVNPFVSINFIIYHGEA